MKTLRSLFTVFALCLAASAPAQQLLITAAKNTGNSTLESGATYTAKSGSTFTIASGATFSIPDAILSIAKTSGLQTALDAKQPLDSDLTAIAALTTTTFGRSLLTQADAAATRTTLGLVIGTDVQAYDSDLASIAALTTTSFGRSVLTQADAAALRTLSGSVIGTNVEAWSANLDTWSGKTPYAGTVVVTTGKTFTSSNTLTLSGTDGSSLAIGTGGTLGTAAYTATTAYATAAQGTKADNAGAVTGLIKSNGSATFSAAAAGTDYLAPAAIGSTVQSYRAELTLTGVKGSNIASASTVDLSTATGDYVHVTGTTTITALGTVTSGILRSVVFDGVLTLTYNATSLILPTAANITTQAGDVATFRSEGSGNWKCVNYIRADGTALSSSGGAVPSSRTISTTAPLTGGGDLSANRTLAVSTATTSATGVVQLATTTEARTGTDAAKPVVPSSLLDMLRNVRFIDMGLATATATGSPAGFMQALDSTSFIAQANNGAGAIRLESGRFNCASASSNVPNATVNWAAPLHIIFKGSFTTQSTNGVLRMGIKGAGAGQPAGRGITVEVRGSSYRIWIVVHDGTTLTQYDTGVNAAASVGFSIEIYSNGSGSISAYNFGTLLGSTTGGPTATSFDSTGSNRVSIEQSCGGDSSYNSNNFERLVTLIGG